MCIRDSSLVYRGIFVQRPAVQEELRNALPYLSETFPEVVIRLDRSLELAWEDVGWNIENLRKENAYPKLRFSNWIGGDRDGHPFVTPEVTKSTLAELHENAVCMHQRHLTKVADKLSLAPPFAKVPKRLNEAIQNYIEELGDAGAQISHRYHVEPWQTFIRLLIERFEQGKYQSTAEYLSDLNLAHNTLCEVQASMLSLIHISEPTRPY